MYFLSLSFSSNAAVTIFTPHAMTCAHPPNQESSTLSANALSQGRRWCLRPIRGPLDAHCVFASQACVCCLRDSALVKAAFFIHVLVDHRSKTLLMILMTLPSMHDTWGLCSHVPKPLWARDHVDEEYVLLLDAGIL
eukprot:2543428-Amphidinium_carterae.1